MSPGRGGAAQRAARRHCSAPQSRVTVVQDVWYRRAPEASDTVEELVQIRELPLPAHDRSRHVANQA